MKSILKSLLRIVLLFVIFSGCFLAGSLMTNSVNHKVVAELTATGYLMGCVKAKTEVYGVTDGIIYNQCKEKATRIYKQIMKLNPNEIQLGAPI